MRREDHHLIGLVLLAFGILMVLGVLVATALLASISGFFGMAIAGALTPYIVVSMVIALFFIVAGFKLREHS